MMERTSRPGAFDTMKQITAGQTAREKLLQWRYPWFNVVYNYLIAGLIIALTCSLYGWALDVWAQNRADTQTRAAVEAAELAHREAEAARAAELAAAQKSEAAIMQREAEAVAKAFYGIRNFIVKYHYTEKDLKTYARCMFNRADAADGLYVLETVIGRKDQFLGYDSKNPVLNEYYTVAQAAVEEWHRETVKPCDVSYQFAELTESGIYLAAEFGADGYARRWQA
jgi:hypothetical protein